MDWSCSCSVLDLLDLFRTVETETSKAELLSPPDALHWHWSTELHTDWISAHCTVTHLPPSVCPLTQAPTQGRELSQSQSPNESPYQSVSGACLPCESEEHPGCPAQGWKEVGEDGQGVPSQERLSSCWIQAAVSP